MRPQDVPLASELTQKIVTYDQTVNNLPGISDKASLHCLVLQLIDSIRRIRYVQIIRQKPLSNIYVDANRQFFDPLKAAAWSAQNNMLEEAFWLVFISIHFGKNRSSGWSLAREVYRGSGSGAAWTWGRISTNFLSFRNWLNVNSGTLHRIGKFGNHRKYQSLDAFSNAGTGNAIGSYIEWVTVHINHESLMYNAISEVGNDPKELFAYLYRSMSDVVSFGRTAKFDYLTMIGKLGLAKIEPDSTYIENATGPKGGAKLLFGGSTNSHISDRELTESIFSLQASLGLYFGMQVLEDALCNWQKNPHAFVHFAA